MSRLLLLILLCRCVRAFESDHFIAYFSSSFQPSSILTPTPAHSSFNEMVIIARAFACLCSFVWGQCAPRAIWCPFSKALTHMVPTPLSPDATNWLLIKLVSITQTNHPHAQQIGAQIVVMEHLRVIRENSHQRRRENPEPHSLITKSTNWNGGSAYKSICLPLIVMR